MSGHESTSIQQLSRASCSSCWKMFRPECQSVHRSLTSAMNRLFSAYRICRSDGLTELGVVEGEVPQVCRVLGQREEASRQTVPHEVTPRGVPQYPVLDDLHGQNRGGKSHLGIRWRAITWLQLMSIKDCRDWVLTLVRILTVSQALRFQFT